MNIVLYRTFLVILAVLLGASSIEGSFLSGFGMRAVQVPPHVPPPNGGIVINKDLYAYIVDVFRVTSNQTSNIPSEYFGIGCFIVNTPITKFFPHLGPDCIRIYVSPIFLVLNCNPNVCINPFSYGPVSKRHVKSLGTAIPPTFIMDFEYPIDKNSTIIIKNATTVYSGATLYCSLTQCQSLYQLSHPY
jgi:hypothetical protein